MATTTAAKSYGPNEVESLRQAVERIVAEATITDLHTHLYAPPFGELLLWGVDELLTYHYLIAETIRATRMAPERFFALSKQEQADVVWRELFIERSPVSEACRGVLTVLQGLGLDTGSRDLDQYREYFASQDPAAHVDRVLKCAHLDSVVMTNDPFDDLERSVWLDGYAGDPRFHAALRIDPLLNNWPVACQRLQGWGYNVNESLDAAAQAEVCRFLADWLDRTRSLYMAVSLPPDFAFPEDSARAAIIESCILPLSRERGVPFALMIGVLRSVNPALQLAGDGVALSGLSSLRHLCANYPENRFMATLLARENQHELTVMARKFPNLFLFGCWWFLNNPSLIDEMTRMRLELLGLSVAPQHSDARVLEQVIYKWEHSRQIIGAVLQEKYADLVRTGWIVREDEIRRDVDRLFRANFWEFVGKGGA